MKYNGKSKEEWQHELETWEGVNPHLEYQARQALNFFEQRKPQMSKADLRDLNKDEQIAKLKELGVSDDEIKKLRYEKQRVDKLFSLL